MATKRLPTFHIAALTFQVGAGSNEAQLLPDGEFRSVDGSGRPVECASWRVDADIAAALVADINARINPLPIDYEHATLKAAAAKGDPAPAAGWFRRIEYRPGRGIYAVDVEWTARARDWIEGDEYRYISCVFLYDAQGRVTKILHASLTNTPALDGMDEVSLAALSAWASVLSTQPAPQEDSVLLAKLIAALGLDADASEDQVIAACSALKTQSADSETKLAALSTKVGAPDPAKFVPIAVMQDLQGQVAALSAQVNESKVADLVDVALSDGRLLPAQEDWARGLGKTNIAALTAYLDTAPKIAALSGIQTGGKAPDTTQAKPDDALLAVCSMFGNDPAAVQQTLNQEQP